MIDAFGGCGGVGKAVLRLGFLARKYELLDGYDLTAPAVLRSIRQDILAGRVLALMLAPPCTSFSIAQARNGPIRSKEQPLGLPALPPHRQAKVDVGNRCMHATLQYCKWAMKRGVPWIIEHPQSSYMWRVPAVQSLFGAPAGAHSES